MNSVNIFLTNFGIINIKQRANVNPLYLMFKRETVKVNLLNVRYLNNGTLNKNFLKKKVLKETRYFYLNIKHVKTYSTSASLSSWWNPTPEEEEAYEKKKEANQTEMEVRWIYDKYRGLHKSKPSFEDLPNTDRFPWYEKAPLRIAKELGLLSEREFTMLGETGINPGRLSHMVNHIKGSSVEKFSQYFHVSPLFEANHMGKVLAMVEYWEALLLKMFTTVNGSFAAEVAAAGSPLIFGIKTLHVFDFSRQGLIYPLRLILLRAENDLRLKEKSDAIMQWVADQRAGWGAAQMDFAGFYSPDILTTRIFDVNNNYPDFRQILAEFFTDKTPDEVMAYILVGISASLAVPVAQILGLQPLEATVVWSHLSGGLQTCNYPFKKILITVTLDSINEFLGNVLNPKFPVWDLLAASDVTKIQVMRLCIWITSFFRDNAQLIWLTNFGGTFEDVINVANISYFSYIVYTILICGSISILVLFFYGIWTEILVKLINKIKLINKKTS